MNSLKIVATLSSLPFVAFFVLHNYSKILSSPLIHTHSLPFSFSHTHIQCFNITPFYYLSSPKIHWRFILSLSQLQNWTLSENKKQDMTFLSHTPRVPHTHKNCDHLWHRRFPWMSRRWPAALRWGWLRPGARLPPLSGTAHNAPDKLCRLLYYFLFENRSRRNE